MIFIEGEWCRDVEHTCLRWLDPPPYQALRCAEYQPPARCRGPREKKRFCIDRDEVSDEAGLPVVRKSWTEAQAMCGERGARLCEESE